jgi:hypothetical protein
MEKEGVFTFSKPIYTKTEENTPGYVFNSYYNGLGEPAVSTMGETPTVNDFLGTDYENNRNFIVDLCNEFVKSCSKYFPNGKLTVERVKAKLKHIIKTTRETQKPDDFEGIIVWQLLPLVIVVSGIQIQVYWELVKTYMEMTLDDDEGEIAKAVEEPLVQLSLTNDLVDGGLEGKGHVEIGVVADVVSQAPIDEIIAVDDIAGSTGDAIDTMLLNNKKSSTATKDKASKKLREARLQVQLAKFRAARAYEKYVAKYGDDLSDTDGETTDYASGSEGDGHSGSGCE